MVDKGELVAALHTRFNISELRFTVDFNFYRELPEHLALTKLIEFVIEGLITRDKIGELITAAKRANPAFYVNVNYVR